MIKELFETSGLIELLGLDPISFVKKTEKEAEKAEDDDFVKLKKENETAPTCSNEYELRDYIKSQRANILKRGCTHVIFHCTATQPTATVTAIMNYWKNVRKWINPGYHIIIGSDFFTVLADFARVVNGASGYNSKGLSFSYIGGIDKKGKALNTMTAFQKRAFEIIAEELLLINPKLKFIGHNEVANKACPSYKVKDEFPKIWTGK